MARNTDKQKEIAEVIGRLGKKFGKGAAASASLQRPLKTIPTGILGLDYRLGVGGWARGHMHVVYGPPDIGKSSAVGLSGIVEAQKMGLNCAIIAVEPHFTGEWAERHGVDTESLVIARPDNAEEAFEMLHELVYSEVIDYIVFDSIGALVSQGETDEDGKMKVGGQAGLITWGVKRVAARIYKDEITVIFLNQVRDNMKSPHGGLDMPGGHALEHMCTSKVRLRSKDQYTKKVDGDDIIIGREIIAIIERNKLGEGTKQKAVFDYYQFETDTNTVGVDHASDSLNTALLCGVIEKSGSWLTLPGHKKPMHGVNKVVEYLDAHAEMYDVLREGVLKVMVENNKKTVLTPEEGDNNE